MVYFEQMILYWRKYHNQKYIESEVSVLKWQENSLKICFQSEDMLTFVRHDTTFLILSISFFKKVSFSLKWDVFHKVKRVIYIVDLQKKLYKYYRYHIATQKKSYLGLLKSWEQSVGHKLNILLHKLAVHANQFARYCIYRKLKQ